MLAPLRFDPLYVCSLQQCQPFATTECGATLLQLRLPDRASRTGPMEQKDRQQAEEFPGSLLGLGVLCPRGSVDGLERDPLCVAVAATHEARASLKYTVSALEFVQEVDLVENFPCVAGRLSWQPIVCASDVCVPGS